MKKIREAVAGIIALFMVLTLAACSSHKSTVLETGDITKDNLPAVSTILTDSGLSNVNVFEKWVNDYADGSAENAETSGFDDADCRMTVMLLAGDSITHESVEDTYDGTYLMFDVDLIENNEDYSVLKDKKKLFTTLFGEMAIPESGFENAFPDNVKKHGITFTGEKFSIVSLVLKTYEKDAAFVGHTGILIDTRNNLDVGSNYVFVEKIAFYDSYLVTKLDSEDDLLQLFSSRSDYTEEGDDTAPLVYKNAELIGTLEK